MRLSSRKLLATACVGLFWQSDAWSYCRATTCDPVVDDCPLDDNRCPQIGPDVGLALYWPSLCVTFSVQQLGSPLRNISSTTADNTLARAFQTWISADCGNDQTPDLGLIPRGSVACDQAEFNAAEEGRSQAGNANILIFQDTQWPYGPSSIDVARTTLTFDNSTGAILDADIEINSFANSLSPPGEPVTQDLQAILTHEAGHFLGLAHSSEPGSSMNAQYALDDLAYRTLSEDDSRGICELYPPQGELSCPPNTAPVFGYSIACGDGQLADRPIADTGCQFATSSTIPLSSQSPFRKMAGTWWLGALGLVAASRRRATGLRRLATPPPLGS